MTVPDAHTHLSCLLHPERQDFSFPVSVCSTQPSEWNDIARLAKSFPGKMIPSFGIHPWHADESSLQSINRLKDLLHEFPDAGIGEIGLDHTRSASSPLNLQQEIFEKQLRLACETNRIISIHCVKAWGRLLDSLEEIRPSLILIHGWKGPVELLPRLLALGCRFSIGLSTMEEKSVLALPADRILTESDDQCSSAHLAAEAIIALRKDITFSTLQANFNALYSR